MTLKEQFDEVDWLADYAGNCEKIVDDFAICFAEWLIIIYNEDIIYHKYTTKELLEIYKKKGL